MGSKSAIEWTEATWTPVRARNLKTGKVGTHCEKVSAGCVHCYAERRNRWVGTGRHYTRGDRGGVELFLDENMLTQPLRWKRPRMIFVCSQTDLFADFVPDDFIDRVFAVMALSPDHTFQVLTKRAERMREYMEGRDWSDAANYITDAHIRRLEGPLFLEGEISGRLDNVWLGVSAEDQQRADERIRHLLKTPAALRFVSAEPLLGPLSLPYVSHGLLDREHYNVLDWVIVGGESGPGARPMHPAWVRSIRDQCVEARVPFFFKQWGEWAPAFAQYASDADADYDIADAAMRADERLPPGRELCLETDGDIPVGDDFCRNQPNPSLDPWWLRRVGKKAAGRELDGREWSEFPKEPKKGVNLAK